MTLQPRVVSCSGAVLCLGACSRVAEVTFLCMAGHSLYTVNVVVWAGAEPAGKSPVQIKDCTVESSFAF